jgi:hypothetical protein
MRPAYPDEATMQRYIRDVPAVRFAPAPGSTIEVSVNSPDGKLPPPVRV